MSILSVCLALASTMAAQGGAPPVGRVAVVNVPSIFERYLKTADLEATMQRRQEVFAGQVKEFRAEIDRVKRSLHEELKPGTPEYQERAKKAMVLETELQWFTETERQKHDKARADSFRQIYEDIRAAVGEVAGERGIAIVVAADQLPTETPPNPAQTQNMIMLQKVIYWHPGADITEDVITRMNSRYQQKNLKPTPGLGKPPLPSRP